MVKDTLNAQLIKDKLCQYNVDVYFYEQIDSTNTQSRRLLSEINNDAPFVVISDYQTKGRGRQGKSFYSPKSSGIYMSIVTKFNKDISNYTICAANSVCMTLNTLCGINAKIKWVNDIFYENRKVCGILCETVANNVDFEAQNIICGIGVNFDTKDFPQEIQNIAGSLYGEDNAAKISRNDIIVDIVKNYLHNLELQNNMIIDYYKANSLVLGKQLEFIRNGVSHSGIATDILHNGNLVVKTSTDTITLSSGEISLGSETFIN